MSWSVQVCALLAVGAWIDPKSMLGVQPTNPVLPQSAVVEAPVYSVDAFVCQDVLQRFVRLGIFIPNQIGDADLVASAVKKSSHGVAVASVHETYFWIDVFADGDFPRTQVE